MVEKASIDEAYLLVMPHLEQGRAAAEGELLAGMREAADIARRIKQSGRHMCCSCCWQGCMCCSRPLGRVAAGFKERETCCKAPTDEVAGCCPERVRWASSYLKLLLHASGFRPEDVVRC